MLYLVFNTRSLVSILSTFATNLSYRYLSYDVVNNLSLTTLCFTTSLNLLKSAGTGANLSMSSLSTSVFKLTQLVFSTKLEVSTCEYF